MRSLQILVLVFVSQETRSTQSRSRLAILRLIPQNQKNQKKATIDGVKGLTLKLSLIEQKENGFITFYNICVGQSTDLS